MKILSIHDGHNATICYMENGEIKYLLSEERFTNVKNQGGLVLIGKTAVLKTAGLTALGVRVPHPPHWRVGRAVMQRIANPSTPISVARVQISHSPQDKLQAPLEIAGFLFTA